MASRRSAPASIWVTRNDSERGRFKPPERKRFKPPFFASRVPNRRGWSEAVARECFCGAIGRRQAPAKTGVHRFNGDPLSDGARTKAAGTLARVGSRPRELLLGSVFWSITGAMDARDLDRTTQHAQQLRRDPHATDNGAYPKTTAASSTFQGIEVENSL